MHLLPFLLRIYVQGKLVYTCKNFAPAFMHFINFFFIIYLFFYRFARRFWVLHLRLQGRRWILRFWFCKKPPPLLNPSVYTKFFVKFSCVFSDVLAFLDNFHLFFTLYIPSMVEGPKKSSTWTDQFPNAGLQSGPRTLQAYAGTWRKIWTDFFISRICKHVDYRFHVHRFHQRGADKKRWLFYATFNWRSYCCNSRHKTR